MGHHHSHLTLSDRRTIEALLNANRPPKEIAAAIHVHVSTIYREVNRARMVQLTSELIEVEKYNPDEAHRKYRDNLAAKGAPLKIGRDFELVEYLEKKMLEEGRSPAAALADIKLEGRQFATTICVTTLYSYITKGVFLTLTNSDLPEKPKRKQQYRKVQSTKRAPRGTSIEKRPGEIDTREEFGHWEMDTVYSSKKSSKKTLLVLSERKSRQEVIERMPDRTAQSVVKALNRIERRYGELFPKVFKSITVDNGVEFSDVKELEGSVLHEGERTHFYYCHPYSSYERGTNENINKMIRRRYPKGTDFGKTSTAAIKKLEDWINNYPRKLLGWKTSEMVFRECLLAIQKQT